MTELPKAAHRTQPQKAQGYFNAAEYALGRALFHLGDDHPQAQHISHLIAQIRDLGVDHG